jgi:hypothetical protein
MSGLINRRLLGLLVAVGASLLLIALGTGASASASTIYACQKKKGGAIRIVSAKTKCNKKTEKKISWNTQGPSGPAGKNGTNGSNGANGAIGTNGSNGANGAVAGYSASQTGSINITSDSTPATILSKPIPAGSYITAGKVQITAYDTSNEAHAGVHCELVDTPTGGSLTALDGARWMQSVDVPIFIIGDFAEGTLSFNAALSTGSAASTLAIRCEEIDADSGKGTLEISASEAKITAVQTTSNS